MLLNPKKDDLLMDDAKVTSWRELCMWDGDKDKWRVRYVYGIGDMHNCIRTLRAPSMDVTTSIGYRY